MKTISFEQMPSAISVMTGMIADLQTEVRALRSAQPINEPPIDGAELRKRLNISRPTEITMRNKGKLPFLTVNGQYRYQWTTVLKALSNLK
ncbi:hypothetical protein ABDK00_006780 [Niabella insulamsoli]|uniref:hypothetical protein n=1 Tax=Niabella insulamsoli TaxID=3144874 RepID=UPI0031FCFA93